MPTPHDQLFQFTFRHGHHAASWVRSVLPAPLASAFDPTGMQPLRERFPGVRLRPHLADASFVAPFRTADETLEVLLLLEHKSFDDPDLGHQLLRYSVHLQRSLQRERANVPMVLPIVLQHGRSANARRSKRDATAPLRQALGPMQPRQQVLVDDLDTLSEPELAARAMSPLAELTLLCLGRLPDTPPEQVPAALLRWQHLLRAVDAANGPPLAPPLGADAIDAIGWYALAATEVGSLQLAGTLTRILHRDASSIMSTLERTFQKGRMQGLAEGKAEGKADTLLRQVTRRFGPPAPAIVERLRGAPPADLDRWTDRILDARSLDELFAEA